MSPIPLQIAYLGGGSREWARKLMIDLALCPELTGDIALYDIDQESAHLNEQLGNWIQNQPDNRSKWKYRAVNSVQEALTGADFVIISIQPGSLEVMAEEIAIAEKYGLFFPVGDTSGAPGLIRGLRSVKIYEQFAEKISQICPKAWVINYTNPMSICVRTLTRVAPGLKVIGCCHEVFAVQKLLASLISEYWRVPTPDRDEIKVNVLGVNHFTWFTKASWNGRDLVELVKYHIDQPGVIREYSREEVESWNDWFKSVHQVKYRLFQHFGNLPAAGDRHLVEFLPAFIQSPDLLFKYGIIRTPVSYRIARWQSAPQKTRDIISGKTAFEVKSSGEEGVRQIKALVGLGDLVTNVNFKNLGQISNLPMDVAVETNSLFQLDEVHPITAGPVPASLLPLMARHCANHELVIESALTGNKDLAFQAIYTDPTNSLTIDQTWSMFTELLTASREYIDFEG